MTGFIPHHFEKLKTELLEVSGIKQIIPSDCKRLSADIYTKTHKQISETTLKRVFGFAYTPFRPSVFTISALAEYCGYSGWNNFSQQCSTTERHMPQDSSWTEIVEQAKKVTGFTLQTLKNRTGIPYQLTIDRKFIDEHFDIFANEPFTGTILSAPEGYGKTTALCHWVDKRIKSSTNTDIVFFFNCSIAAGHSTTNSLTACLHTLLGMAPEHAFFDIDVFENTPPKGKFYLIVDGINDCNYKRNEFHQFFSQLIDVVSLYRKYDWFKVILSIRSAAWINNRHFFANKMDSWFVGFTTDYQQSVNVPLFDGQEIALLADLIEPLNNTTIQDIHIYNLGHPLYFQYYYQLHQQHFSMGRLNTLSTYELTTEHVVRKVYRGKFNDDKVLLLHEIVDNLEHGQGNCYADKQKINEALRNYQCAYQDLLSAGILKHSDNPYTLNYESHITFGSSGLLHFLIAEKLISDNKGQFNDTLIALLEERFGTTGLKMPVLKWILYNMVTGSQNRGLGWLAKAGLTIAEQAELILMLGQLLQKQQAAGEELSELKNLFNDAHHQNLFNYMVGAEFMDRDYEQSLLAILNFSLTDHQQMMTRLYLSLIAVIKLDISKLEKYLSELKLISPEVYRCMPVNPLLCLDAVYFYLKFGIIKKEPLTEITRFCFNPVLPAGCNDPGSITSIIPMLTVCISMLSPNPRKTIRFVEALQKTYPAGTKNQAFLLKTWLANAYALTDKSKAMRLFDDLTNDYFSNEAGYTTFMKISYYALRARIDLFNNAGDDLPAEFKQLISLCDQEDHKMIKVTAIAHLLNQVPLNAASKKQLDHYYFDLVKTVRGSNCRTESFLIKTANTGHQA